MINAAFVRECKPRAKMYEVTCDALPGFILRVLPTGKKVALVRYRVAGKDHRERIGLLSASLSIDEARRRAAVMLASAAVDESDDATSRQPVRGNAPVWNSWNSGRLRSSRSASSPSASSGCTLTHGSSRDRGATTAGSLVRAGSCRGSGIETSAASGGPRSTSCTPG
jgi:hypothetical protein